MLYKNTKVKVLWPDGDTDFFDKVAGGLQGNTLAQYLFIICVDYMLRTSIDLMKENGIILKKGKEQKIPRTNYYECGQHSWYSASGKYTNSGRIPAA